MALSTIAGFNVGGTEPIDKRLVLTKAEMLAFDDSLMPSDYLCMCSDDHKMYQYNKNNTVDSVTGKFRVFEGGGSTIQYTTLPENPSVGQIIQYVGENTDSLRNGSFYKYINPLSNIAWNEFVRKEEFFTPNSYGTTFNVNDGVTITYNGTEVTRISGANEYWIDGESGEIAIVNSFDLVDWSIVTVSPSLCSWVSVDTFPSWRGTSSELEEALEDLPVGTRIEVTDDYDEEEVAKDFMNKVRSKSYAKYGEEFGLSAGFLRQGRIPKKVVVIGNSMTAHGRRDDIGYTVDDMREMAASTPTSGWVSILYRALKELNPSIEMYKTNGANWETSTLGSRDFATIEDNICYKMVDTGCEETTLTLGELLDENTDMVVCQLYENVADPENSGIGSLASDYRNLYNSISSLAPNAKLYQHAGFWQNLNKHYAIISACKSARVEHCWNPRFNPYDCGIMDYSSQMRYFEHELNDEMYDNDGNVICTITDQAVADHPSDNGFKAMAATVLFHMYNTHPLSNNIEKVCAFGYNDIDSVEDIYSIMPSELFYAANGGRPNISPLLDDGLNNVFAFWVIPGRYEIAISNLEQSMAQHGFFEVQGTPESAYNPIIQKIVIINAQSSTLTRGVALSATETNFLPWICESDVTIPNKVYAINKRFDGRQVYRWSHKFNKNIETTTDSWINLYSEDNSVPLCVPSSTFCVVSSETVLPQSDTWMPVPDERMPSQGIRTEIITLSSINKYVAQIASPSSTQTVKKDTVLIIDFVM